MSIGHGALVKATKSSKYAGLNLDEISQSVNSFFKHFVP
jgi:hypothetical protein